MRDGEKTKDQLLIELSEMRKRVAELETAARVSNSVKREMAEGTAQSDYVLKEPHSKVKEQKAAEEGLRADRIRLRSILRALPTGIGVVVNRIITEVNEVLCGMIGYSKEELLGRSARMLYPTDEAFGLVGEEKYRQIAQQGIGSVETRWQRKDGRIIDIFLSSAPIDSADLTQGVTFTATDITERKEADRALKESEERFRAIAESVSDWVYDITCSLDKEMKIVWSTPQFLGKMGYAPDEVQSLSALREIVHPEDRSIVDEWINEIGACGDGEVEYRIITKDGQVRWLRDRARYFPESDGWRVIGAAQDVTERKQAEESLRDSERRLSLALESAHMGMWEWDIVSDRSWWNRIEYELLGLPPAQGPEPSDLFFNHVHPEDRIRVDQNVASVLETKNEWNDEFRIIRQNGEVRWIASIGRLLRSDSDAPLKMIGVEYDITERKQMEEELLQSQERLRSLADHLSTVREDEKAKIARDLHDELGQSLTAVLFGLSLLHKKLRKDQGALAGRIDALKTTIKGTIETVKRIQGELRPWMLDNLGLCATMDWQAKRFTERTHIPVTFDWNDETVVDQKIAVAIFRIFQEALTNAARHSGGTEIRVGLLQDDNEVKLSVSDNGRGIEQNEIHKAFSFGLLGIKERVEALNGSVRIEGRPGKGTTLRVRIPNSCGSQGAGKDDVYN